jgi:hypothetical protein
VDAELVQRFPNNYSLANYFVAHLRQTLDSVYARDDWHVNNKLTLNLGLRWEYGSPYSEQKNYTSNVDSATQTVLTITPGATPGNGITPFSGVGVYGKTLLCDGRSRLSLRSGDHLQRSHGQHHPGAQ